MNDQQFERLVQSLQDIMRCPNCSSAYAFEDIHYLGQLDTMTFLHLRCHKCNIPVFASIAIASPDGIIVNSDMAIPQGVSRRKLNTDENDRIFKKVTHDDVLEVHSALFDSKGDLGKFLAS